MPNERNTENVVRGLLQDKAYYSDENTISVEEQKSNVDAIRRMLRAASKDGSGKIGFPEFVITCPDNPDFVIIIECKASTKDHVSAVMKDSDGIAPSPEDADVCTKRVKKHAVDGALHYASFLASSFNVIAIGVSGETKAELKQSVYLVTKGTGEVRPLKTKAHKRVNGIIGWDAFIEHATFDEGVQKLRIDELMEFSRDLHEFMRAHAKLTESEKPLLVSGTLLALKNKPFSASYGEHTPQELQREWLRIVGEEIQKADIPLAKKDNISQAYSGIAVHPELGKPTEAFPKGVLNELITRLKDKVWPFLAIYGDYDVVGQFYGEFLKYTGGDKKALGIVLTPRHITDLFARLANVQKDSRVLDICAGTGGFLIASMHHMLAACETPSERDAVKAEGLVGVEQLPNMFALAASNMILRGDGKANLHQGSCLDSAITKAVLDHKCTVGMLNPPFSQSDENQHELKFVLHMLSALEPGSVGLAIVPMSCAIAPHPLREQLLKEHTLEAVMSLPDELFYPVGTITCAMVFTAKKPHAESGKKSWFGHWKDDGFIKTKHRGRIDAYSRWPAIRANWVEMFRNREVHPGISVLQAVGPTDEWCAEAYMETDYQAISESDFVKAVRDYAVYRLVGLTDATQSEEDALGEGE